MAPFDPQHQALAAAVLQAPSGPALDQLATLLLSSLQPLARHWLSKGPALCDSGDEDDLIQGFLASILQPAKLIVLLRPVAAGQKPLLPRVKRSFANFLMSRLRKADLPRASTPLGTGEDEFDPADRPDHWPLITERVAAQGAAIREAVPAQSGQVPLHAVLLLDERLRLVKAIAASFAPEDGRTVGNQTVGDLAEAISVWTTADSAQPLPTQGLTLDQAWRAIRQQTQDRPQQADPALVAGVLGIGRWTWNTWVRRGRNRLVQCVGRARARELFPDWPAAPFEQADPDSPEAGHE